MVLIPKGSYDLGAGDIYPEEDPARKVQSEAFYIDRHEVTNAEFSKFVKATGYETTAERNPDPKEYPGADPANLAPGSACFMAADDTHNLNDRWEYKLKADWKHPEGPGSEAKPNYPVVHVTSEDAAAYAKWAGKDLPTQDEWEIAARGGLVDKKYAWGDDLMPDGKYLANTYQGKFPTKDEGKDGHAGLASAGSYPPNGYGLYDMIGNVWELTKTEAPFDKTANKAAVWAKGGSFLCADNYCARYRPSAKIPVTVDTSTNHIGFRCVVRG
jgi:formylglycine-generating enzyme required for sulfatase activity